MLYLKEYHCLRQTKMISSTIIYQHTTCIIPAIYEQTILFIHRRIDSLNSHAG